MPEQPITPHFAPAAPEYGEPAPTLEWWGEAPRKLTLYFDSPAPPYFLKVWGPNLHSEMEDGDLQDNAQLQELFCWLGVAMSEPHEPSITPRFEPGGPSLSWWGIAGKKLILIFGANEPPRYLKVWGPYGSPTEEGGPLRDSRQLADFFKWLRAAPEEDEEMPQRGAEARSRGTCGVGLGD